MDLRENLLFKGN